MEEEINRIRKDVYTSRYVAENTNEGFITQRPSPERANNYDAGNTVVVTLFDMK